MSNICFQVIDIPVSARCECYDRVYHPFKPLIPPLDPCRKRTRQ